MAKPSEEQIKQLIRASWARMALGIALVGLGFVAARSFSPGGWRLFLVLPPTLAGNVLCLWAAGLLIRLHSQRPKFMEVRRWTSADRMLSIGCIVLGGAMVVLPPMLAFMVLGRSDVEERTDSIMLWWTPMLLGLLLFLWGLRRSGAIERDEAAATSEDAGGLEG